jgi:hypothetical protein
LADLFDPAVGLLPEYQGSSTYWLFHDNYLAAKVLESSNENLSRKIRETMASYSHQGSGKIEIVFGEAKNPLPFRGHELIEVKKVGTKTIKTELLKDTVNENWASYADLLALGAMAEGPVDKDKAVGHLKTAIAMWDGRGLADRVRERSGLYATFKLALLLLAAAKLDHAFEERGAALKQLLATQSESGGFITDYDKDGKPIGEANVETTCLAILGIERSRKMAG